MTTIKETNRRNPRAPQRAYEEPSARMLKKIAKRRERTEAMRQFASPRVTVQRTPEVSTPEVATSNDGVFYAVLLSVVVFALSGVAMLVF